MPDSHSMPFLEHLEELRRRMIRGFLILMTLGFAGWYVADPVIKWLLLPLAGLHPQPKLIYLTPPRLFMVKFWVGMAAGIVIGLPYLFWEVWSFVAPALLGRERKVIFALVIPSVVLFILGLAFAFYVVIPMGLDFLLQAGSLDIEAQLEIGEYLLFLVRFGIGFGIIFQLPVVIVILSGFGLIGPAFLLKYWRHAVIIILIVAAILTPPDVVSQTLMAIPLFLLYILSIAASWITLRLTRPREETTA
jgi:sec-independent protein translocase protein TatC